MIEPNTAQLKGSGDSPQPAGNRDLKRVQQGYIDPPK